MSGLVLWEQKIFQNGFAIVNLRIWHLIGIAGLLLSNVGSTALADTPEDLPPDVDDDPAQVILPPPVDLESLHLKVPPRPKQQDPSPEHRSRVNLSCPMGELNNTARP